MRALVLAALTLLACSSSPESASTEPDGAAGAAGAAGEGSAGSAGMAGAAGVAGAGGVAGAAGSPSSGGTAGAPVGGAGGSSGAGGSGGSAGSGGSSGGGAGGMAGASGTAGTSGAQQCPEACVANVTFNWSVASGPPNAQGYGKAYSDCPAGSTFDDGSTDLSALYCFDCSIAKPSHVAATGQYVCTADIGAPVASCTIHFRCKAQNWCVPLAKPCP